MKAIHTKLNRNTPIVGITLIAFSISLSRAVDDPPSDMRTLEVTVVDETGAPIEGVNIHRSVWTKTKFKANAEYTTDEKGTVRFDLPRSVDILRLWTSKDGFVPMFSNFDARDIGGDPVPETFTFRLPKGSSIGGFVKNVAGEPIKNARVEVAIETDDSGGDGTAVVNTWLAIGDSAPLTDKIGFWSINNVPGEPHKIGLRLSHPDYVDDLAFEWRWFDERSEIPFLPLRKQTAEVAMDSGTRIKGRITNSEGNPVSGAMIIWADRPYHNSNDQEAFSDDNGAYHLPSISDSTEFLTVVAQGYSPVLAEINLSGGTKTINFSLKQGHEIRFKFIDEQGDPVDGARVNILGWRGTDTLFNWRHPNVPFSKIPDKADANGEYVWTWAPEDRVTFLIGKEGYQEIRERSFLPGAHKLVLKRN